MLKLIYRWSVERNLYILLFSPLCDLTSWQVAEQLMTIAYESGVNLFDTAEVYAGGRWVLYKSQSLKGTE